MKVNTLVITCLVGLSAQAREEKNLQTPLHITQQTAPQAQHVQKTTEQDEPDFGIPMLATFLTQIVPGIAKTIVGSKKNAPELAIEGTQQLSTGIVTFLSLIPTRNNVSSLTALQDPAIIDAFLKEHAENHALQDMLTALEQLQAVLTEKA